MSYIPKQLVLLSKQAASASASISFTSVITSAYTSYVLQIRNLVPATNATTTKLLFSTDNGATYLNANYVWNVTVNNNVIYPLASTSDSSIQLHDTYATGVSNNSVNGYINFYNLGSSSFLNRSASYFILNDTGGTTPPEQSTGTGFNTTLSINAIRLQMSSGNITSGNFYFYGVVEP